MKARRSEDLRGPVLQLFRGTSQVGKETTILILLSAGDLLMTYLLLWQGGRFYESNPIALWFFNRWNIAGMTAYKFGLVAFIVVLSEIIERHRPGWGRAIVLLGGLTALIATVHGFRLLMYHG